MKLEQIDLKVDFNYDPDLKKIINITYDETKGYKADGLQCVAIDSESYGKNDSYDRCVKPALKSLEQSIYYTCKKQYYTVPKLKSFSDRTIILTLPLDKIA